MRGDHAAEPLGERPAAQQDGPCSLDRDRRGADQDHGPPRVVHERLHPIRQASPAATIGTPNGAIGVSARAIAAPRIAACFA